MGDSMFYKHLIIENTNEKSLYLFIDFDYEFGLDFRLNNKKGKAKSIYNSAVNYMRNKKIDFKAGKVLLVVGSIVIGSFFINEYRNVELSDQLNPKFQYVEHMDIFGEEKASGDIFVPPSNNQTATSTTTDVTKAPAVVNQPKVTQKVVTTNPSTSTNNATPTPTQPPVTQSPTTSQVIEPKVIEPTVTLYRYNGTVEQLSLEDYVVGVVAAEMPASFNIEALKAQSVLARTYALKRINQTLKDDTSNQVYKDTNQLKKLWGSDFQTYYNKIKKAVDSTKNEYLSYNATYAEVVYHSTSNGATEDALAVWGNDYPYLKSVASHWDIDASSYLRETEKEFNVLSSIIGLDFNSDTNIQVLSRTPSNRIDKIQIGDKTFTGIELRALLGLRSTDFDIRMENGKAVFVTKGYGHGVGMSQYGANGMAKEGYNYKAILSHYYPGTQIKT